MSEHAALGASSAHRWMNCPGSVAAEAGLPEETSVYAQEGTAAHALATECLTKKRPAKTWLGEFMGDGEGIEVTEEMAENVQLYVDFVQREIFTGADRTFIEHKFDLAPIKPPVDMFGTTDANGIFLELRRLKAADLKFGKGVAVSAVGNVQTRYYLLGSWIELALTDRVAADQITTFEAFIVQPRILDEDGEPTITSEVLNVQQMKAWARDLLEAARKTQIPGAARIAGSHCKFCKAKPHCAEYRNQALAVAQLEFADVEASITPKLPTPDQLTPAQIAKVLEHKALLTDWLDSIEGYAIGELERGRLVPGYALKPKRATRKWINEEEVVAWAEKDLSATADDLYERKLKSPAQLEKLTGKKKIPERLITAESSGLTLCRDTDPKAVKAAINEFN